MLLLSLLALVRLVRTRAPPHRYCGFVFAIATTLLCIVFSGQSRYHFPAMPFLIAYAGWYVVHSASLARDAPRW
jgi:hypothetical protein